MTLKFKNRHILLLLILLLGTVLRVYRISEIPFTHDELSVIFRTGYTSFSELISDGVKPDVHPAGVQVFMNYWVALFGKSGPAAKLPFVLFGIISIFLIYRIGKEWFSPDVGLISAAFVSAMEYTVMHSQTIRPYASGLVFSLLMVYAWQRYLLRPGKTSMPWLITWIIASAICAYNHYFSLMLAAVVGLTGLFFIKRRQILTYLIGCASIFILYVPHLNIFFSQFRERGVGGWLGEPHNDFILEYTGYAFHHSPFVLTVVGGIVLAGILSGQTRKLLRNRFFYISLAWFFIPFLIAFFYSRYVNPVLQLRVMIFYFPFLLFLFTGNLPDLKKVARSSLVVLICLVLTLSLIFERQYYHLFYRSRFKEIIVETDRSIQEYGSDNCLVIMDSHEKISEYYYDELDIRYDHYIYDSFACKTDFMDLLENSPCEYLSLGVDSRTEFVLPRIIMDRFPFMNNKIDYQGGNYYLFSRHDSSSNPYRMSFFNGFDGRADHWSPGVDSLFVDSAGCSNLTSYYMGDQHAFGPSFTIPLGEIAQHKNDLIDVAVAVRDVDSLNTALLVLALKGKKELVAWTASPFSDYDPHTGEWYTVYHSFRPGRHFRNKKLELQVYIWNRDKNRFLSDDFRIMSRPGNPVLYGLQEKI